MGLAVGVFGVSYGVLAVAAGLPASMVVAMSVLVFSGGAQFAAVGIVAAGGGPWAAVVPGLLLSTRFVPLGLAAAPFLGGPGCGRWRPTCSSTRAPQWRWPSPTRGPRGGRSGRRGWCWG